MKSKIQQRRNRRISRRALRGGRPLEKQEEFEKGETLWSLSFMTSEAVNLIDEKKISEAKDILLEMFNLINYFQPFDPSRLPDWMMARVRSTSEQAVSKNVLVKIKSQLQDQ